MWRLLIRQPVGGIPEESSGGNPGEDYYYNQSVLALLTEYSYYAYSCNRLLFSWCVVFVCLVCLTRDEPVIFSCYPVTEHIILELSNTVWVHV